MKLVKNLNISKLFLIATTFLVGLCSLLYELLISTTSSYFLGDSVKQFSIIIGVYLATMGLGSYLSRFIRKNLIRNFVLIEIALGFIGAFSVPLCYWYYTDGFHGTFQGFALFLIAVIGVLTGYEIPLLSRILGEFEGGEESLSDVLTYDYFGALIATLLFPFFFLPKIGLFQSSLIAGFINISVGLTVLFVLRKKFSSARSFHTVLVVFYIAVSILIGIAWIGKGSFMSHWNDKVYRYPVVYEEVTPYQNITITKSKDDVRLYLNGAIQFSSRDEYRYHEALVHVGLTQLATVGDVLILGGGEGLAAREVLKYKELNTLTIVDLDARIGELAKNFGLFKEVNEGSLLDPRVRMVNEDAFAFIESTTKEFDAIIIDLPDPTNESLARLYSDVFYGICKSKLRDEGVLVTQATSPELATSSFWCINETIKYAGFEWVFPYQTNIPSFGNWGFIMASKIPRLHHTLREDIEYQYLSNELFKHLFFFPKDVVIEDIEVNLWDAPKVMDYYLEHWHSLQAEKR